MIFNLLRLVAVGPLLAPTALLATGGAVGYWFGIGSTDGVDRIFAAAVLAIAAFGAIIWQYRRQARERWQAAMNRYAEREIARSHSQLAKLVRRAG
jgi:uncharacterized protein (UPF0333 family)